MDDESADVVPRRRADNFAEVDETRQKVARTAENVARIAEQSADVHEALTGSTPDAREHAARDRRLATAERASAAALRRGALPPESARQVIRAGGRLPDEQAQPTASEPRASDIDQTSTE
jgi:hypothetical protein